MAAIPAFRSIEPVDLQLISVEDSASYFVYRYEAVNPGASTQGIAAISLDVSASFGTPSSALTATGDFISQPAMNPSGIVTAHAPIGPISPANWRTTLRHTAVLMWTGANGRMRDNDSIPAGDTLTGLGMRSTFLPAIREVGAVPTWQSCCTEAWGDTTTNPQRQLPNRDDFMVSGTTVGPRYAPDEVTIDVLQDQVEAVCNDPLWIDDAPLCTALADSLNAAETRLASGDNVGARAALEGVLATLDAEREPTGPIENNAYWLLRINAEHILGSILGAGDVATGSATGGVTPNGTVTSVVTSTQLNGGTDQLYLAQVNIRSTRVVSSVSGGGLTWTLVGAKNGDRGITRIEVWKAFGSPGSAFNVTANMATAASTVTLTAIRYTGAAASVEDVQTAGTGGTDNANVAVTTTSATAGAVHFVALNLRDRIISSPDPDYGVRGFVSEGTFGEQVNSCTFDHPVSSPGSDAFTATLNNPADWAVVAFVINPAASGFEGEGGQTGSLLHVDCTGG